MTSATSDPTGSLDTALRHTTRLLDANPRLAVEQAEEILKAVPDQPMARLLLGIGHRMTGEVRQAVRVLETLTRDMPRSAPAFFEYGMALLEDDEADGALQALQRAVDLQPTFPDAWRTIGDLLTAQGDLAGADAAYGQHLKASTVDPRLLLAGQALVNNQVPEAEYRLREHLKAFPTDVAAIRMLAEVAGRLGRLGDAETLLRRALELAPSFHAARHNLALVLHRQSHYAAALEQLDMLCAADPRDSSHRNLKASVLAKIGEYPDSLGLFADILTKHPDRAKIWENYAHALSSAGRNADAIAAYRRCIELLPHDGSAYWSLANLKTFRFTPDEVSAMRSLLTDARCSADDRASLHFAIGKALEDGTQYEDAFTHYRLGNAMRLSKVGYDASKLSRLVDRSVACLTRQFMADRRDYGCPAPDPIFIVGLPRAGSTLIEQILSSHSMIEGTMELPNIISMASRLGGTKARAARTAYPDALAALSPEECRALGEQYLAETRIQRKSAKPFFIDKMPNNFQYLGFIKLILPNARIIDARRHPLSCCFSGYKQNFAQGQRFTYSLEHLARYYSDYVRLMAHYDAVVPGAVHRVIYEQMVDDTEAQVRSLLAYVGVEFEPATLRFYENERAVRTPSAEQVRQPIYRQSLEVWRNFEPWLGPLKEGLGEVLAHYPDTPEYSSA